ncbi:MAG: prephenate dehydratase [Promethearchaeota archaeon]|jgi:chorismate mutase/prephenate dehydratase
MNDQNNLREDLDNLRDQINKIDDKIVDLLNDRANIAIQIGPIKEKLNLKVFQPEREKEVINRIIEKSSVLKSNSIEAIWKEIMSASKLVQGTITRIGYLGPQGTFTHQAALDFFPKAGSEFITFINSSEIFENIEKGIVDYGVVPIENSLQGTVRETLDLLIEKNLSIYGEIELRIVQNLIALNTSDLSKIKTVFSHPQAFAQTSLWIKTNLPNVDLVNVNSTADAVRRVNELQDETYAAIGTDFSSKVYDVKVLNTNIEDNPLNFTRFLIISKNENEQKEGKIKTSVVFVTKHTPGALYRALKIYADANINLLKIESRPRRKGRWEYIFLMDFEGDKDDPQVETVLNKMSDNVIWYKILGSYPIAK